MATPNSYDDLLAQLSDGLGGSDDAAGGMTSAQPSSYDGILDQLSTSIDEPSAQPIAPAADPNDWWGKYWGHLKDPASQAYHATSKNEAAAMPKPDPLTLTKLLSGRGEYLNDIDKGGAIDADATAKERASLAARRLARIDQVLALMGQAPEAAASDSDEPVRADVALDKMSHAKLMASDRYRQVYESATPDLMTEDERQAYARTTIAKEANDTPYLRDSILAQIAGLPSGKAFMDRYMADEAGGPPIAEEPGMMESAGRIGHIAGAHLGAGMTRLAEIPSLAAAGLAGLVDYAKNSVTGDDENEAQDWVFRNFVEPGEEHIAKALLAGAPVPEGFAEKTVAKIADFAPGLVAAGLTRNPSVAGFVAPAATTALEAAGATVLANVPTAAGFALPGTVEAMRGRAEQGATAGELALEAPLELGKQTVMNTAPIAAPGSLMARLTTGGGAQAALGASQRAAVGEGTDLSDIASDVVIGAGMGAMHREPGPPQSVADAAAAREGFSSAGEARDLTKLHGAAEARFAKTLERITDPAAIERADYALSAFNAGERNQVWLMSEIKHIADTGSARDEPTFAHWQSTGAYKLPDDAATDVQPSGLTPDQEAAASDVGQVLDVTPAELAGERASEQAAADAIGMEPVNDPDAEPPRFRLDSALDDEPTGNTSAARAQEEVDALADEPYPHVPASAREETLRDLGEGVVELTKAPSSRQLPDAPPEARTLADIAAAVVPDAKITEAVNVRSDGKLYHITVPTKEGPSTATLRVEPSGRLQFDVHNLKEGSGYGARLYHVVNEFAHRNGLVAAPDDAGLSEVNTFRRTEQQLASAGRTGSTSHLQPDASQNLRHWKRPSKGRENSPEESHFNTGHMAHTAMENLYANHPDLSRMRYNFDAERYEWADGKPVHEHDFRRIASSDAVRSFGGGSSSLKRAVWTASVLRAKRAGGRIRDVASTSRERMESGWTGAGDVALTGTRYRLSERTEPRSEAREPAADVAPAAVRPIDAIREGRRPARAVENEPRGSDGAERVGIPSRFRRSGDDVDAAAHESATSPLNERREPTSKQTEAGNYPKGHVRAAGLDISIENPRGSTRSGTGPDGKPWSRTMNHHYGYIRGTVGADGGHMDVLLGDQPKNPTRRAFVVDQHKADGSFDEHKVLLGFRNQHDAEKAYHSEYPKGWKGMGRVREMSVPELKTWLKSNAVDEARVGPVADNVPRLTMRHQQPDAHIVHASAKTAGDVVRSGEAPARMALPNANMSLRRRVVLDEVKGSVPKGHGSAVLRNIYDLASDPRKLMERARAKLESRNLPLDEDHLINEFEREVVAQGFDGYRSEGKIAVLGHDVPVARNEVAHETKPAEPAHSDEAEVEKPGVAGREGESDRDTESADEFIPSAKGTAKEKPVGLSKDAADGLVKVLKWHKAKAGVSIHESEKAFPAEVRALIPKEFQDRVHGMYHNGKVYIAADKMSSPRELYRTLAEEHLGHGGLRTIFRANDLNAFLDSAYHSVPKDERAQIARDYHVKAITPEGRRLIAEEYLAKIDPAGVGKGIFEKFRDWFNETGRKMGLDVNYSPSELRAVMAMAHDHQRSGLSPSINNRSPIDMVTPRLSLDGGFDVEKGEVVDDGQPRFRVERQKGTPEQEAAMARTMAVPHEDMTLGDRARSWLAEFRAKDWGEIRASWVQGWLDSGNEIKRIERDIFGGFLADASESPYKMYNLSKNAHAVMGAAMKLGVPEYRDGAFQPVSGRKGIFEVFRPLYEHADGKSLMPLWEFYAASRRAARLIDEQNYDGTARENNFTRADIARGYELEKQYPEFARVADDFDAFNKQLLDLAVDRGALSRTEADAWSRHFYVPFMRAIEDVELARMPARLRGSAASNQRIYSRRLSGGEAKIESVFENILANTAYVLDRTYKQEFMNRLRDMGEGTVLHKVPMASKAIRISNDDLARALWKGGLITGSAVHGQKQSPHMTPHWAFAEVARMTQEQKQRWSTIFERVAPKDPDIVPIMTNGKTEYYRVSDPLLLRAIGAMGHDSFGKVVQLLSGAKRAVTWSITKDPGFMAATWFRDTLINWVASSGEKVTPFVDSAKGALASIRHDPIIDSLMMAGVGVAPHYETQGGTVRNQMQRRFGPGTIVGSARTAMDFYNKVGMAAEASSRVAIARAVLGRGGSMAEAAYQAQDILNYGMRGDYSAARIIASTAPFWNAGMQGLYRFARGAGVAEAVAGDSTRLQSYALRGSVLLAATMANMWRNQDDPRYNRLTQEDKDRYWHFWVGDEHFKLPKPFEAGVIFGTLPERIYQRAVGNDTTKDLMRSTAAMITDEMRLNVLPQIVRQGVEQWANKDTSSWRSIVPAAMADQLPEDQWSPYTSLTARAISGALPEKTPWLNSPKRVESLVRGLTGTLGVYAMQGADWLARQAGAAAPAPTSRLQDMPVVKRFYAGEGEGDRSKYEDKLYELRAEADATFASFGEAVKRVDTERAGELASREAFKYRSTLDEMGRQVSTLRAAEKQILNNPFLGPDDKRERVDQITEARMKMLDLYGPMLDKLQAEF